jgi:F-type H+-transporting ATPase subunit delta
MSAELEVFVARSQNRLTVELTTSYELSDDEARSIVEMIETASGRKIEATRSVDPSLIGGIVLQIGSHRADGSVRGRLERLRHELATTRS